MGCSNCRGDGCFRCRRPDPTYVTKSPPGVVVKTVSWLDDARVRLARLEAAPYRDGRRIEELRGQIAEAEDAQHARAEHELERP